MVTVLYPSTGQQRKQIDDSLALVSLVQQKEFEEKLQWEPVEWEFINHLNCINQAISQTDTFLGKGIKVNYSADPLRESRGRFKHFGTLCSLINVFTICKKVICKKIIFHYELPQVFVRSELFDFNFFKKIYIYTKKKKRRSEFFAFNHLCGKQNSSIWHFPRHPDTVVRKAFLALGQTATGALPGTELVHICINLVLDFKVLYSIQQCNQ